MPVVLWLENAAESLFVLSQSSRTIQDAENPEDMMNTLNGLLEGHFLVWS